MCHLIIHIYTVQTNSVQIRGPGQPTLVPARQSQERAGMNRYSMPTTCCWPVRMQNCGDGTQMDFRLWGVQPPLPHPCETFYCLHTFLWHAANKAYNLAFAALSRSDLSWMSYVHNTPSKVAESTLLLACYSDYERYGSALSRGKFFVCLLFAHGCKSLSLKVKWGVPSDMYSLRHLCSVPGMYLWCLFVCVCVCACVCVCLCVCVP